MAIARPRLEVSRPRGRRSEKEYFGENSIGISRLTTSSLLAMRTRVEPGQFTDNRRSIVGPPEKLTACKSLKIWCARRRRLQNFPGSLSPTLPSGSSSSGICLTFDARRVDELIPAGRRSKGSALKPAAIAGGVQSEEARTPAGARVSYFCPYRSAKRTSLRLPASRNRLFSSPVFTIKGGTGFGSRVCSSMATKVT